MGWLVSERPETNGLPNPAHLKALWFSAIRFGSDTNQKAFTTGSAIVIQLGAFLQLSIKPFPEFSSLLA
jgi:hypothetical protein